MKRVYHLSSCDTNKRILKELTLKERGFELIDIKESNIDETTLNWIKDKVGSYEDLFSKKAIKYRSIGLNLQNLSEADYKKYLLEEYTFLKRPFVIVDEDVYIGNAKATVAACLERLEQVKG